MPYALPRQEMSRGLLKAPGALGKALGLLPPHGGAILCAMNETRTPAVEVLTASDTSTLTRPGQTSVQLLWPGNSPRALVTLTRVTIPPGATNRRHSHPHSEQTWIVEHGRADLLLDDGQSRPVEAGEIVRTPAGEIHGLHNSGSEPFVYLAVTTPPIDFRPAYDGERRADS